jgi:hypothetical protein
MTKLQDFENNNALLKGQLNTPEELRVRDQESLKGQKLINQDPIKGDTSIEVLGSKNTEKIEVNNSIEKSKDNSDISQLNRKLLPKDVNTSNFANINNSLFINVGESKSTNEDLLQLTNISSKSDPSTGTAKRPLTNYQDSEKQKVFKLDDKASQQHQGKNLSTDILELKKQIALRKEKILSSSSGVSRVLGGVIANGGGVAVEDSSMDKSLETSTRKEVKLNKSLAYEFTSILMINFMSVDRRKSAGCKYLLRMFREILCRSVKFEREVAIHIFETARERSTEFKEAIRQLMLEKDEYPAIEQFMKKF